MSRGWIGVDLDRTLAFYDTWQGPCHVGAPVPKMLERVKRWLAVGQEVRIVTARVYTDGTPLRNLETALCRDAIRQWCMDYLGQTLAVVCEKDFDMLELWDDRAIQVVPNTGERVDGGE